MKEEAEMCPADKKPDISKVDPIPCNPHQCQKYAWKSVEGVCSVSCGKGKNLATKNRFTNDIFCIRLPNSFQLGDVVSLFRNLLGVSKRVQTFVGLRNKGTRPIVKTEV